MDSSWDMLAKVSRNSILDLLVENDTLQCELALLRFGPEAMNSKLAEANDTGLTEVCTCQACFTGKRFCQEDDPKELAIRYKTEEKKPCILKECLLWHAQRLGLTYEIHKEHMDSESEEQQEEPQDRDCDLVIVEHELFWEIQYGKKLSPTNFHRKPSFPELKSLFTLMDEAEEFYQVKDKDFRVIAEDEV